MSAATSAAKLQLTQSPTFRSAPLTEGAFFGSRGRSPPSPLFGLGKPPMLAGGGTGQQWRTKSVGSLEVSEVQALAGDAPLKGDTEMPKSPHDSLLMRLKSRSARQEAESNRSFLASYRAESISSPSSEARLDALLSAASQRAEELRQRSEELQVEEAEAERKLEKANSLNVVRASENELQAMNAFERSQRRIQEDKREEDLQRQRDDVQANYAKVHRRLQSELIELRDYKVLLREYRQLKLEKLNDTLGHACDGRGLRACVRDMIRHGALRILQKLESASLPLDPWMREVLVNCCHLEIRLEDQEAKLLALRKQALRPVKADVEQMLSQSKRERFEKLCFKTWDGRPQAREEPHARRHTEHFSAEGDVDAGVVAEANGGAAPRRDNAVERAVFDMRAVEGNIAALRRLLCDMRQNAAAVICNQIRQAEKASREAGREAVEWGSQMLAMLVSEEFAKQTMKELQKSAPSAKFTQ